MRFSARSLRTAAHLSPALSSPTMAFLNADNFRSFCTPFSQHKIKKGGKGVGRLGWLKVFRQISVTSAYLNGDGLERIEFDFVLRENNQIDTREPSGSVPKAPGTTVRLAEFADSYGARCPVRTETIVQRVIGHFLPVFAGDKSPQMYLHDNDMTDLKKEFADKINDSIEQMIEVEIEDENHPIIIRRMKCDKSIRPRGSVNNWMCFCANDRGLIRTATRMTRLCSLWTISRCLSPGIQSGTEKAM